VPPLQAALALAQVHDGAVPVGEDLDLDVPRPLDEPLEPAACRRRTRRGPPGVRPASASASSSARCTSRMPLPPPPAEGLISSGNQDAARSSVSSGHERPGTTGTPAAATVCLARILSPIAVDRGRRRADEDEPGVRAGLRELGVLGQEAVAGVHGLRARSGARPRGSLDAEVALGGGRGAEPDRLVGLEHVPRAASASL
jgi:hypothetical protein